MVVAHILPPRHGDHGEEGRGEQTSCEDLWRGGCAQASRLPCPVRSRPGQDGVLRLGP
jgi:hypothetical protein